MERKLTKYRISINPPLLAPYYKQPQIQTCEVINPRHKQISYYYHARYEEVRVKIPGKK